jgi:peptidoglycan/LPS O-acetylase OafA/YrhL
MRGSPGPAATPRTSHEAAIGHPSRAPFIDAMRAVVASLVVWHHQVFYGPLAYRFEFSPGGLLDRLYRYRWAVQVFFIISGYVLARTMSPRVWTPRQAGWFTVRRYIRLGVPYLAAIALSMAACACARGWLPDEVTGAPPTAAQLVAHLFFLQDILGYPSLSAGLWFVCIEFQLGLIYVALLWLRDTVSGRRDARRAPTDKVVYLLGGALAIASLYHFNRYPRYSPWAVYYFGQFFLGVMIYHGLETPRGARLFAGYVCLVVAALAIDWRARLATSLVAGLLVFAVGKGGWLDRWPRSRVVARLGLTSYSLFLVHFAVIIAVSTVTVRLGATTFGAAVASSAASYLVSLLAAEVFFSWVEAPTAALARRIR